MKEESRFLLALVVLAGVIVLGYLLWEKSQDKGMVVEEPIVETPAEEEAEAPVGGSAGGSGSGTVAPSGPLTFEEAYQTYAVSGFRFEFADCHGRPGSISMKKGTKFMLDNRDNEAHRFVVGSKTYNIGPYGFAIATATDVGTYNITCDGGGAAQVVVQP